MFLSVFDIFKVGIGPSSSHTMGPMVAAGRFLDIVRARHDPEPGAGEPSHLTCHLHGSLAWTGKGHASDRAIILGLSGFEPATLDPDAAEAAIAGNAATRTVTPPDLPTLAFDPETDLVFDYGPPLPGHANGMRFRCLDEAAACATRRSIIRLAAALSRAPASWRAAVPKRRRMQSSKPCPIPSARPTKCSGWERRAASGGAVRGGAGMIVPP